MTGDGRLRDYAERAIGYTIRSQDRQTGGWRYQPADSGDMSQFGWRYWHCVVLSSLVSSCQVTLAT